MIFREGYKVRKKCGNLPIIDPPMWKFPQFFLFVFLFIIRSADIFMTDRNRPEDY